LRKEKFDILHFHNFGFPSTVQILASPSAAKSLNILTFHANLEENKFLKRFPFLISFLNKICQWRIDGIIGVNPLNLKYFRQYSGPKTVIPNGIDLKIFNPKAPKIKKYLDEKINILFLGRIEERKGLIYLLRAYKILEKILNSRLKENLRLIIGGDGPLKRECQEWARKNRLKNVIFEGKIPEEKTPSYYSSADIFCAPSIFGESFGIVLIEAMASGLPVVAFANKGYKSVLVNKGARFLARPRDSKTLAKKLAILIKNEKLRKEMGKWGMKEAQKYSWPKIAEKVLDFYQICAKEKKRKTLSKRFF
jgi:phosphatidylinositol alpha-mannosyltransferase